MDFSTFSDTALAATLHTLATRLAAARGANDVATVKTLWTEFQDAATEYGKRDQASSLTTFLNSVNDATIAFLQQVGQLPAAAGRDLGQGLEELLKPLIPFLIVLVLLVAVVVYSAGKSGAVRITRAV